MKKYKKQQKVQTIKLACNIGLYYFAEAQRQGEYKFGSFSYYALKFFRKKTSFLLFEKFCKGTKWMISFVLSHVTSHCVKSVQIWSYFWSIFSCIQTEYGEIRSIQSEYWKIRIWNNSVFGHISRSDQQTYWQGSDLKLIAPPKHKQSFKDRLQISLLILSEFKEFINFYSPWNHQKIIDFLIISWVIGY